MAQEEAQSVPRSPLGRVSQRLVNTTSAATNNLTHSERFKRLVDGVFNDVDIDNSGTVDAAELFVAILLVSHKLNKLPLGRKIEPPTKAQVQELLHTETRGDTINREQFLRICQRQFVTMGEGILLNVFLFLIMVPFLGVMLKGATQRLFLRAEATWMHGAAVKTPDSVFAMVVSTVVTLVRAHGGLAALRPSNRVLAMALVVLVPVAIAEVHRIVMPVAQKHGPALAGGLASTVDKATGLKKRAY